MLNLFQHPQTLKYAEGGYPSRNLDSAATGSEAERGADIDRLAVVAVVVEPLQPIARFFALVADAGGHIETASQRIGAADIDHLGGGFLHQRRRVADRLVGADLDARRGA